MASGVFLQEINLLNGEGEKSKFFRGNYTRRQKVRGKNGTNSSNVMTGN